MRAVEEETGHREARPPTLSRTTTTQGLTPHTCTEHVLLHCPALQTHRDSHHTHALSTSSYTVPHYNHIHALSTSSYTVPHYNHIHALSTSSYTVPHYNHTGTRTTYMR